MEIKTPFDQARAIDALSALAQDTRLSVFRLLVRAGPEGVNAGELAAGLAVPASTLSHHLGLLERTGLATSRRDGRMLFYAADLAGISALLGFLIDDCCQGRPELCGPAMATLEQCA